jgi:hypothetical protein
MKNKKHSVPIPIPPNSVVRLATFGKRCPNWEGEIGRVFRVGYYSRKDGLDCIWLVNDAGDYEQTTDHDFLFKYFDVIAISDETDIHGKKRPQIGPIVRAERLSAQHSKSGRKLKSSRRTTQS